MTSGSPVRLQIDPRANTPVYEQIRQQLTWHIARGHLPAGTRLPTIRNLAGKLKINLHTVRQAYHALEADGLLETRPRRGTRVLDVAIGKLISTSTTTPSHTIGVLLPSLTPFYTPLMLALEAEAQNLGYLVFTCFTHDNPQTALVLAQQLVAKNIDGLIAIAPPGEAVHPKGLPGLPVVSVDAPQVHTNSILFNLSDAGYQATQHLLWHGHKRIGLIMGRASARNGRETLRGFKRARRGAGTAPDEDLVLEAGGYSLEHGCGAIKRMLDLRRPPTAVVFAADDLAAGAIQELTNGGRDVPGDIAIASVGNTEFAGLIKPALTTVALPAREMGGESVRMLHAILTQRHTYKRRLLPAALLVVRRSCGCNESSSQGSSLHMPAEKDRGRRRRA